MSDWVGPSFAISLPNALQVIDFAFRLKGSTPPASPSKKYNKIKKLISRATSKQAIVPKIVPILVAFLIICKL